MALEWRLGAIRLKGKAGVCSLKLGRLGFGLRLGWRLGFCWIEWLWVGKFLLYTLT